MVNITNATIAYELQRIKEDLGASLTLDPKTKNNKIRKAIEALDFFQRILDSAEPEIPPNPFDNMQFVMGEDPFKEEW